MQKYELVNMVVEIQEQMGITIPKKYTEDAILRMKQTDIDEIIELFDTSKNHMEIQHLVQAISKMAHDLQTFKNAEQAWLKEQGWQGGVDNKGGIVMWAKKDPTARIVMNLPIEATK